MAEAPPDHPKPGTAPPASAGETLEAVTLRRRTELMTTLRASREAESQPAPVDPSPVSFDGGARYRVRRVLGSGGMGEVRLSKDAWIGRDVAVKVIRPGRGSHQAARARFLREARVQGQLEHPSVVPVYDFGHDADGDFFTMKRVNGETLEEIVAALRAGDVEFAAKFSRRKLLSAMSQVCLTAAFAHSRGVVHRDLKPANVMLGDFGEVYVLDWGVAKVAGAAELDLDDQVSGEHGEVPQTEVGSLVGTPGYMSPEQARGENDRVGASSDVYSLGAILFELLALEPLHRGKTVTALIAATLTAKPEAPSSRSPNLRIPPELDAICLRALADDPEARFQSARALHEGLERYLDGERDAERRHELAREHLGRASKHLDLAAQGGVGAEAERSDGMQELSRALALDPADESALRMISALLTEAPTTLSAEAEAELKTVELADRTTAARHGSGGYAGWLLAAPLFLFMGVKSWPLMAAFATSQVVAAVAIRWMSATGRVRPEYMRWWLVLNYVGVGTITFLFGPFVFTPALASTTAAAHVVGIRANKRTRFLVFGLSFVAVFVPAVLQTVGIFPASYAFQDGVIEILPVLVNFPARLTPLLLAGSTAFQMILPAVLFSRALENLISAERKNFAQAWRLRQLLPKAAQPSVPAPAAPGC
jgi:eukaryotic-like serine/threonine-protein kinase